MEALNVTKHRQAEQHDSDLLNLNDRLSGMGFETAVESNGSGLFFHYPDPGNAGINQQLLAELNQPGQGSFSYERKSNAAWIYFPKKTFDLYNDLPEVIESTLARLIRQQIKLYSIR